MRNTRRPSRRRDGCLPVDKLFLALAHESIGLAPWAAAARRYLAIWAIWLASAAVAFGLWTAPAAAQTSADLQLVIAVDVSLSMDLDEQRLQREGYVAAFRDPELHRAIMSGPYGRIAVVYMEWAGPSSQNVVIPWTLIDSPAAARAFADRLAAQPISRERLTSISSALHFARGLLTSSGFTSPRRVVDMSGDGPNNSGRPVLEARDALVAEGVVINGLPIMLKTGAPSFFDLADLDSYYAACVIGGIGAFMVPVRDIAELKSAIRRKLLLEISWAVPLLRPVPAQATEQGGYDCRVGEKQWRWYLDEAPN
jgi:hypothetical protein